MKSKYIKPMPETYRVGSQVSVVGDPPGRKTAARKLELLCPQAQTIIAKFGGPYELARTLKACSDDKKDHYTPSAIYRWMYPRDAGGTDGEIPGRALKTILKAARVAGVMLSSEDIYPHLATRPEPQE